MSTEELLSLSNNKLLKNSNSSDEEKAEYMRKTLLLRDITSDLPRDSINSVISMANNVVNFFSLGIVEKDSFPTLKDNSVLKDSDKYGEYSSKEDLTNAIQENKKELYLKTGTYNPSANFVADTIVDIASFALLNKAGMNSTAALATSSAINTLGETGSVEDASKSVVSSFVFSKVLDSKLTNKILTEKVGNKTEKYVQKLIAKNPELVNTPTKEAIMKNLPQLTAAFTSTMSSKVVAGEVQSVLNDGKDALNINTQQSIFADALVWSALTTGIRGYKGIKYTIKASEIKANTVDAETQVNNWFSTLELEENKDYTLEDINKQYRKLSKKYHPDILNGNEEAMVNINIAYDGLKEKMTTGKIYKLTYEATPTNEEIKTPKDGVTKVDKNSIYVDTNSALMSTAKNIADSQIIKATVPITENNTIVGFDKVDVVPFNIENSKIDDIFPGVTISNNGSIDVIDINSGAKLLTNSKDIETAVNTVQKALTGSDNTTLNYIKNSINTSKYNNLKVIEEITNAFAQRINDLETRNIKIENEKPSVKNNTIESNSNINLENLSTNNPETLQDIQKSINSIGNNTVYSNEATKNILNYVNDNVKNIHSFEQNGDTYINSLNKDGSIAYQQKLNKSSYKGIEIKEIVNNAMQKADLSGINAYTNNDAKGINDLNTSETKISNSNREITK